MLDEMGRGISCSAEGAPWDCDRDGSNCQCVEDGQRVERVGCAVKWEVTNEYCRETGRVVFGCGGRENKGDVRSEMTESKSRSPIRLRSGQAVRG